MSLNVFKNVNVYCDLVSGFVGESMAKLQFHPRCGSNAEVTNGQSTALRQKYVSCLCL